MKALAMETEVERNARLSMERKQGESRQIDEDLRLEREGLNGEG